MSESNGSESNQVDEKLADDNPEDRLLVNLEVDMQTRRLSIRNIEKALDDLNESMI